MRISYHISWRRNSGAGGDCDSSTISSGNMLRGEGSLVCQYGCVGTISEMSYYCTDYSIGENWSFSERQLTHPFTINGAGLITIGFTGCCWISPFSSSWNISQHFH